MRGVYGNRGLLRERKYPYVARASKSLSSTLQLLVDRYKDGYKLMLILCGSSMSYMEDHVLAYKAPLYGRRTAQMKTALGLIWRETPYGEKGKWTFLPQYVILTT
jgi:AAA+ ATPase superfamily predicted ATPase